MLAFLPSHMGPIGPRKVPYLNQCGNGSGTHSEASLGPIMVAHDMGYYGTSHLQNPCGPHIDSLHGTHVASDRSHVGPISEPMWDPCQIRLENLYGPHNGISYGTNVKCSPKCWSHVGPMWDSC